MVSSLLSYQGTLSTVHYAVPTPLQVINSFFYISGIMKELFYVISDWNCITEADAYFDDGS